ncbi:universal stress protein [Gaiella sp.]|uniref:universal stress protein n=1 Tax=Gaiella sp. TaxID=2663207 RepID=UPI00326547CC
MLGTKRTRTSAAIPRISGSRPVILVTFDVPFDAEATTLAVDAAVESGQKLIVVNVAEIPLGPISLAMKYEYVERPGVEDALRAPADLAHSLAVKVERLRLCSPRPVDALLELVAERAPGLLVVGPDRELLRRRTYAKLAKKIRDRATCLVWLPG